MVRAKYVKLAVKTLASKKLSYLLRQPFRLAALGASLASGRRLAPPLIASLIPTYRCNSACAKCRRPEPGGGEMSTAELLDLIRQLYDLKVSAIDFTGGEPLLRDDIFELVAAAASPRMFTHLSTNGYLLDPERADRLIASGVDSVNVSLDSAAPGGMDASSGVAGAGGLAVSGLRNLLAARAARKARTEIGVVAVLGEENSGEMEGLCRLAAELGADGLTINPLHSFPEPLANRAAFWEEAGFPGRLEALKREYPVLENSAPYLRLLKKFWRNEPLPLACAAARSHVMIGADRRVYPCFPWPELDGRCAKLGSSLKETLASAEYEAICRGALACRRCYWNSYIEFSLPLRFFSCPRVNAR